MVTRIYNLKRDKPDERDFKIISVLAPHDEVKLPKRVDLRDECPKIFDQGNLGSCTANAGVAYRLMLLNENPKELSRLYLYYKERAIDGDIAKDSGSTNRNVCKALYKYGVCEEKLMPYVPEKFAKKPSRTAEANAKNYKVIAYRSLSTLDDIKSCIALRQQPVIIGMEVFESFESEYTEKTGIMRMPKRDEKSLGGHSVLIVGYDDRLFNRRGGFIVRNSWGESWGDKGYFYMPYKYVLKGHTWDYWIIE